MTNPNEEIKYVMIGRCSFDSNHEGPGQHLENKSPLTELKGKVLKTKTSQTLAPPNKC